MPLFEYLCRDCGKNFEVLLLGTADRPHCTACNSSNLKKLLSAHSSMSGSLKTGLPGPGDTTCCGTPLSHSDCVGPGSCCEKI